MFIWSLPSIRKALESHLPDIATAFASITEAYGTPDEQKVVNETYLACRSISIDYGVMEKADNVQVSCADFGWSDIGTWGSLYAQLPKDPQGNALSGGNPLCQETTNCLVKETIPNKRLVIDNLHDYVVVDTPDVLMICPRTNEDRIKKLIEKANE
jgi:mannose-1-phosphate guanylyltransferase